MKKMRLLGLSLLLTGGLILGGAPSAQATTCIIADDEVEAVVCTVYATAGAIVCKPLEKFGGCTQ